MSVVRTMSGSPEARRSTRRKNRLRGFGLGLSALLVAIGAPPAALLAQSDAFPAADGEILITPLARASVQVEYLGFVVHIDPWSGGHYSEARPADIILVTDTPPHHLDPEMIRQLRTPSTMVIMPAYPADARDEGGAGRLRQVEGADVMSDGERAELTSRAPGIPDVTIESVAMYDLIPGEPFHARGEGNGYILTLGGVRIYFAGVTECTPEVQGVEDVDIAFVPMNLPNGRMPPGVAAECVMTFRPDVVYPYH